MGDNRIDQAAMLLAKARLDGNLFDRLPDACCIHGEAEAYAAQDRLHAILEQTLGHRLAGRKIGCTTKIMQRYLGIDSPCSGGVYDNGVFETGSRLRHSDYRRVGVECEIAVRLAADLTARSGGHDRETVADAVASCMAAIEIVDDRYLDYHTLDTPTLIADDFFHAAAVLGPAVRDWRSLDLASLQGRMSIDDDVVGDGVGAAILGHPFEALAWLANAENARGRSLPADDVVLLGSLVQTQWVGAGARIEITIDGLGSASVMFD